MRIIITRPAEEAHKLAAKLTTLGHEPVICPLLDIVARPDVTIPDGSWQAICATSANAFKFLQPTAAQLQCPVYTVGPQSLAAAKALGFHQVQAQGGNVQGLAAYLVQHLQPEAGPLLYLAGSVISGDLKALLEQQHFKVEKYILYDAVAQAPDGLAAMLDKADSLLLYSPRTAKIWHSQIRAANLEDLACRLRYFCLSEQVAQTLPHNWPKQVAQQPHEAALLSLLDCAPGKR